MQSGPRGSAKGGTRASPGGTGAIEGAERPASPRGSAKGGTRASQSGAGVSEGAARPASPQGGAREGEIARNLAVWYGRAARDLPWRRTRDPYRIWLSEVMLQQTRVDTVIPYFERFLARFPDAGALASAPLDDVLALWAGLGYYSRARALHRAAQQISTVHGGALPQTAHELRALSGIGPYTAGAIASIAFDAREPLVDGNVARVLARVFGIAEDARSSEAQRVFWETAARLVNADDQVPPSILNQALMELGALVCAPSRPACGVCPLARLCVANLEGRTGELPVMSPRTKPKPVSMVAAVVWHGGRVLLARRSPSGLFGGLWEPPLIEAEELDEARAALEAFGIDAPALRLVSRKPVRHILSHRALSVVVARAAPEAPPAPPAAPDLVPAPYDRMAWVDLAAAPGGLSTLATKILAAAPDPQASFALTPSPSAKKKKAQ
jgi:A/G-specific adenine glycosylase